MQRRRKEEEERGGRETFLGQAIPILPAFLEARVQVGSDDALIQLGAANVLHAVQRVLMRVVFDEAESARRLVEAVEAHYQPLDLAASAFSRAQKGEAYG